MSDPIDEIVAKIKASAMRDRSIPIRERLHPDAVAIFDETGRSDEVMDRPPGHVDSLPSRAAVPEPPPEAGEGDVWAEIIERLEPGPLREACIARRQMGVEKYGQPLQRGDGRDHAVDEAQEHLDAAAYRAARAGAEDPGVMASLRRAGECLGIVEPVDGPTREDLAEVIRLMAREGHTEHCAKGITYAGQECECGRSRAPEYHTMAPPPGGWRLDDSARLRAELRLITTTADNLLVMLNDDSPAIPQQINRLRRKIASAERTLERSAQRYPVRVVRHAGGYVLLLTDSDGHPWPIWESFVMGVDDHTDGGAFVVLDGDITAAAVEVREPAADILRAMEILRAERGGEE